MNAASPQVRNLYDVFPKQRFAFDLIFRERIEQMLFGGALGGGKSVLARALAAYLANLWPGSTVGIFRRTDKELQTNHVNKWLEEVDAFVPGGRFFQQKMEYHWPSPSWCWCAKDAPCVHSSITAFCHIDENRGARKYQGAEFAAECLDEATHFRGVDIDYLYTRIRAGSAERDITGPDGRVYHYPGWPGWLKLQVLTANPGDVGQPYMIANYINPEAGVDAAAMWDGTDERPIDLVDGPHPLLHPELGVSMWEEWIDLPDGTGHYLTVDMRQGRRWTIEVDLGLLGKANIKRAFVPSRLVDNPAIVNPMEYAAGVAVGSADNRRRLLEGDWSFFEGKVFTNLNPDVHLVDARWVFGGKPAPPIEWPRLAGLDHGTTSPTAAIPITRDEDGFFIAGYWEYYAPGPNKQHIDGLLNLLAIDGMRDMLFEADPRMWHAKQGYDHLWSVADEFAYGGPPPTNPADRASAQARGLRLHQSKAERIAGRMVVQRLLDPHPDLVFPDWHPLAGRHGAPKMFICKQAPNLWREVNGLRFEGEGEETAKVDDHGWDALYRAAVVFEQALAVQHRQRYVTTIGYAS